MSFIERLAPEIRKTGEISTIQINVGKICNLACSHCHVQAGPKRTETMSRVVMEAVLEAIRTHKFQTLDITGGAPEMNENFRWLVSEATKILPHIIVRTNLTILLEKGYEDLIKFYADHGVELVASLPCYTQENVDAQRGHGTFEASIEALKRLNAAGYGRGGNLKLNLVYNPGGAFLPGAQAQLEADYKRELKQNFGIEFDHLFTITNVPMGRFAKSLEKSGELAGYMKLLRDNFNPCAAPNMMCRFQISVGYDGKIYDCDFNQMQALAANGPKDIFEIIKAKELGRQIVFRDYCYACTAGAGSSCGGALA
ncbi:arsenosugar biosynthesis radical SAM (seleno)protein ArsS [uncultured Campylobacter sp.]|uniref:arsenosugar biosynthesis radical SAM (seleno)protein ArsS n=1 Tax=uncultured Campylobacter sp. TaxID=218934 RepID=UPI002627B57C|nr:arsenosugar biosynthesis radical SAM (seleno)protein ArsS [uncultured Campylobacter sp.]